MVVKARHWYHTLRPLHHLPEVSVGCAILPQKLRRTQIVRTAAPVGMNDANGIGWKWKPGYWAVQVSTQHGRWNWTVVSCSRAKRGITVHVDASLHNGCHGSDIDNSANVGYTHLCWLHVHCVENPIHLKQLPSTDARVLQSNDIERWRNRSSWI